MTVQFLRPLAAAVLMAAAASCVSTLPSAEQMDAYERAARQQHAAEYAELRQQRAAGQLSEEQYQMEVRALDRHVQEEADTKAWSRHALAQSELKANSIPTPDQPVELRAPGAGSIPDSMYNTPRNNPMTGGVGMGMSLGAGARY